MSILRYGVSIRAHGPYAKTKGIIAPGRDYIFCEPSHETAYHTLCGVFQGNDKRPLSGKSYLYKCVLKLPKVGDAVRVLKGYKVGYNDNGTEKREYYGRVSEIITDNAVSVEFPGYHTKFVDFGLSEIEPAADIYLKRFEAVKA